MATLKGKTLFITGASRGFFVPSSIPPPLGVKLAARMR